MGVDRGHGQMAAPPLLQRGWLRRLRANFADPGATIKKVGTIPHKILFVRNLAELMGF